MKVKYLKYIPLQEMVEAGMDEKEIILANVVMAFSKDDKELRAGFDNIAEAVPSSNRTVRRTLESLQKKGFVNIASGYKQRNANTYYPTKKLKSLYGQNGHINKAKLATHTPKGYVKKPEGFSLAKNYGLLKEYQSDLENFNESYALERLNTRINIKKNT